MAHQVSIADSTISSGRVFWARNVSDLCLTYVWDFFCSFEK
jgi:hypothetical protein